MSPSEATARISRPSAYRGVFQHACMTTCRGDHGSELDSGYGGSGREEKEEEVMVVVVAAAATSDTSIRSLCAVVGEAQTCAHSF